MPDPSALEKLTGVFWGLRFIISHGLALAAILHLYQDISGESYKSIAGIPLRSIGPDPDDSGRISHPKSWEIIGAISALGIGMGTFLFVGILTVEVGFFYVLITGQTISHYPLLYLAGGAAIIVTVWSQHRVPEWIRRSTWRASF
jgi:hypothetical protein